jgi:hypothetical protein
MNLCYNSIILSGIDIGYGGYWNSWKLMGGEKEEIGGG